MPERRQIHALKMPRHDPHRVVRASMDGSERWTALDDVREGHTCPRNDIFMVLIESGEYSQQFWVYPSEDGIPRGEGWQYLTKEEQKWCREENARILTTVAKYPEYGVYLR
jgi:hypothetical protein